ncbi:MFS transporter [Chitinophaga filiformis]|uniref:MFS transporter n=1 Tax=Chitinophaga filiformis TaxID=104663 RepID=A0ABY4HZA4_CHIFI|nr:MFS transporter [Chitinophaga filiformis]UPK69168.1 MFS transporter [Chitinophaga filiformis]
MDSTTIGKYRWRICALLFFATTINYIDRQVIGLLKPILMAPDQFNWTEKDFGGMMSAFAAAYAVGLLVFGRLVDRIGTKMGYILSIVVWSIAAMGHALAKTTFGFGLARVFLGLGESGNFPVAIKTVAEWFPKKERALATGIFNSGANIGAVIAPIVVPWLAGTYGWQHAFIWTGLIGFIWLIFWAVMYEIPARHKKLTQAEYDHIHSDDAMAATEELPAGVKPVTAAAVASASAPHEKKSISWKQLLGVKQTWAFVFGKLLTDPIWWFFLFWLPSYFATTFNLDFKKPNLQLFVIYTATTVGSIGGGYLSSWLIKIGWPVFKARKTSMLLFAICVVPIMFAKSTNNIWVVVGLISLAAAAHQAWSANIFTTASDMFPKHAVSSVVGIGGMAGSIGGSLFPILVGYLLDYYKAQGNIGAGYNILFLISGSMYLLAWFIMHLFAPRMEQVKLD